MSTSMNPAERARFLLAACPRIRLACVWERVLVKVQAI